jgi:hypothetical protein
MNNKQIEFAAAKPEQAPEHAYRTESARHSAARFDSGPIELGLVGYGGYKQLIVAYFQYAQRAYGVLGRLRVTHFAG